jgi:uncharacterized protein YjbI with pentapeptide repeats
MLGRVEVMDRQSLIWRLGILVASSMLITWLLMIAMVGHGNATAHTLAVAPTSVQGTLTPDSTTTALEKEKLTQEIDQLKNQNSWSWTAVGSIGGIIGGVGTILLASVGYITVRSGLKQWLGNRQDDQKKRDEERFQAAVEGLGDARKETRIGAAIILRTFLESDYKRFYRQTFDLVVAHLRLQKVNSNKSKPLDSLSQALVAIFKMSFPLTRDLLKQAAQFQPESLDATGVHLDKAYLRGADLGKAWLPTATLQEADLTGAQLSEANLREANFTKANLQVATLVGANLAKSNLTDARLDRAQLSNATLNDADLTRADLTKATLTGTHPEAAKSLEGTKMIDVIGFNDPTQRKACEKKGAIFVAQDSNQSSIPNIS